MNTEEQQYWTYNNLLQWKTENYPLVNHPLSISIDETYLLENNVKTFDIHLFKYISMFSSITEFHWSLIDGNSIKIPNDEHIINNIQKLTKVKKLFITDSNINKLPKEFECMSELTHLHLNNNKITNISNEICDLINLNSLNVSYNEIKTIFKNIGKLKNLEFFNCSFNEIVKIPKEISSMIYLKNLNISDNCISNLPKELYKLQHLEKFDCSNNVISEIPIEYYNFEKLEYFDCSNNDINTIPIIPNLKKLICNNNNISSIPKTKKYQKLNSLICIHNKIESLSNLKYYTNLTKLDCSHNKISKIHDNITCLTQINYLRLTGNKIKNIPNSFFNLKTLKVFFCDCNELTDIPQQISQLNVLIKFNCSDNKITSIPIEIMNINTLELFNYSNNEIMYIPPQITRWIHRFRQQIYDDKQSVHNHHIQKGVIQSINYVTSIKPSIHKSQLKTLIIDNQYLTETTKQLLYEYIDCNEIHSILNLTFEEILLSVYDFILKHENKENLFIIMNVEIQDGMCKCFTGRISRLINVLNGYDENININISDSEQIGNIIIMVKNKYPNYNDEQIKKTIKDELIARNYDDSIIEEWIQYL